MQKFETKSIDDATPEELREYAASFLGIPTDGIPNDQVLAKVRAANDGDTIYVRGAEAPPPQIGTPPMPVEEPEARRLVGGVGRDDPKVRLTLHAEERDGVVNNRHKEVGVNGVVWLLKRGVSLDVPYRVYLALNDAERDNISHDAEGNVIRQRVKNTPFNVERMPSQAEIDAWHERTRDQFVPA